MYCKFCGKKIADDSLFCCYCGKQINETFNISENKLTDVKKTSGILPIEVKKADNVNIPKNGSVKKTTIANEVIANIKMIGCAIFVLFIFYLGFYIYHANDIKPMDDNSYFGESCYDGTLTGSWEFSWERHYYTDMSTILPYSQWNFMEKAIGFPKRDYSRRVMLTNMDPKLAIKYAEDEAKEKNIPDQMQKKLIKEAKEAAKYDKENFRETVTNIREFHFEEDRDRSLKWCAIISLSFFVLGRYLIKFYKWVYKNKSI